MKITSKTVRSRDNLIKVHAVSTGKVAVKTRYLNPRYKGLLGLVDFVRDKNFTPWLPIYVWVIEHPEGNFLIDTGENCMVSTPGYFKDSGFFRHWFNTTQFRFEVSREDEIDRQLQRIGLGTEDIQKVVLSHLHLDHIDGLRHFGNSQILVNKKEWEKPYANLPKLYPKSFSPVLLNLNDNYFNFEKALSLTQAQDFWLVETPGHTFGHCSLILQHDDGYLFFAGDVAYEEDQLHKNTFSAGLASPGMAKQTYFKIKEFSEEYPVVFLPTHEWEAQNRLVNLTPLVLKSKNG